MAHKKGLGSSRNGRDSNAKRLGVKVFAGQAVTGGEIIVRQRGTRFHPGEGVGIGRDDTIFATRPGTVQFAAGRRGRVISVEPAVAGRPSSLPALTYSIVARDTSSGELGVAVQSHFFGVGSIVSWAEAGVGAVATQSMVEPAYGPKRARPDARRQERARGARSAAGRRPAGARSPGRDDRPRRARGRAHRRALHPARRPRGGRPGERPGEHHGARHRAGGDGARLLDGLRRSRSPSACSPLSTRRRRRAATCAVASPRLC